MPPGRQSDRNAGSGLWPPRAEGELFGRPRSSSPPRYKEAGGRAGVVAPQPHIHTERQASWQRMPRRAERSADLRHRLGCLLDGRRGALGGATFNTESMAQSPSCSHADNANINF